MLKHDTYVKLTRDRNWFDVNTRMDTQKKDKK